MAFAVNPSVGPFRGRWQSSPKGTLFITALSLPIGVLVEAAVVAEFESLSVGAGAKGTSPNL